MNEFGRYNAFINLFYFISVITLSMIIMNPLFIAISLFSGFTYAVITGGRKTVKNILLYALPLFVLTAVINPLLNHQGKTIISYLPSGNPITKESIYYGIAAAAMIIGLICHFINFNRIMTGDKLMCVAGKMLPSISLVFTMSIHFAGEFAIQVKKISNAQKAMGRSEGASFISKLRNAVNILLVLVSKSMENSIEISSAMRSRGYGLLKRTAYTNERICIRDTVLLLINACLFLFVAAAKICGKIGFTYFPEMTSGKFDFFSLSAAAAYFIICMLPVIIEIKEDIVWKKLRSRI